MNTNKNGDTKAFSALLLQLMEQEQISDRELACEIRHVRDGVTDEAKKYSDPVEIKTIVRWRKGENLPKRRESVLQLITALRLPQNSDGKNIADRLLRTAGHQELNTDEIRQYFSVPEAHEEHEEDDWFVFTPDEIEDFEDGSDEPGIQTGKKLREFQSDIYKRFNDLKIQTFSDYEHLAEHERQELKQEILAKMIGLGQNPKNLLEKEHVNTRFPATLLSSTKSWEMLHRKTAIYSDLALIDTRALTAHAQRQYASHTYLPEYAELDDQTVSLLLLHRPLIERGKMSVVPEILKRVEANGRETTLFNIHELGAVKVNLKDKEIKSAFFEQGKLFQPAGNLVFRSPHGMGLNLEQILEIIQGKYPAEYEYFQTSLRNTMLSINPEDDTQALRRAIRAVDEGILDLEGKYETAKHQFNQPAPGGLAVVFYAADREDVARFVSAAFQGSQLSELVSFVPTVDAIPAEIKHSPFFIPWLIRHQGKTDNIS